MEFFGAIGQPLEEALDHWRVESAHRVASPKRPGFMAVGPIAQTGVFRLVPDRDVASLDEWLDNSEAGVDAVLRSRPPKHAADIYEQTMDEHAKGFCSELYSRRDLVCMFGRGRWRPLERF